MSQSCFRPGGLRLTEQLVDYAQFPPEAVILDIGCGEGATIEYLISRGYQGYGIDHRVEEHKEWISWGNMLSLSFFNEEIDGVISECSISVCGDVRKALEECYRVMKIGGWLLLSDVFFDGEQLPNFVDGRPLTINQWYTAIEKAGFSHIDITDVSPLWKEFVIEQLWAGKTLEELWCGTLPVECKMEGSFKVGYFLLWGQKGE